VGDHDPEGLPDAELDDDALLARVADVFNRFDPVPDVVVELARLSFGWRDLDAELATLVADSHVDEGQATVRAVTAAGLSPRLLSFEAADGFALELEVATAGPPGRPGEHRHLLGLLVPPGPARIEVRQSSGSVSVEADDEGRFAVTDLAPGPFRLTCHRPDEPSVSTPWLTLD
jgi:hypothetical protein